MVFLDTNIFLYVVSRAEADQTHKQTAQRLIAESDFGVSVQILQEFMNVTLRKRQLGLSLEEITGMVYYMATYPVVDTSVALAQRAFEIKNRYQIRYWDAAIIAAASELGCHTLYSENLNHGQDYDGVHVVNPFL
jgi:predicted nucleic acid-binding protein